ncbi:MAG: serine acetyltransferase [Methylobacter sp.]
MDFIIVTIIEKSLLIERWLNTEGFGLSQWPEIPSIYDIWQVAQIYLENGDSAKAAKCEFLIRFLHNSFVSIRLKLGSNVDFAYGGIGIVIHKDAEIGNDVMIGQGVTIGGAPGTARFDVVTGQNVSYPKIGDFVYISAGARVIGGIEIGSFSIVGANAVLKKNVPPFSVCAGVPVREIKQIEPSNFLKYKGMWAATKYMTNENYLIFIQEKYQALVLDKDIVDSGPSEQVAPVTLAQKMASVPDVCSAKDALLADSVLEAVLKSYLDYISPDFDAINNQELQTDGSEVVRLPFTCSPIAVASDGEVSWHQTFENQSATNTLFFYSLQWIGNWLALYEANGDRRFYDRSTAVLNSYYAFLHEDSNETMVMGIRASDHSVSIRIRVLVKYLQASMRVEDQDQDRELQRTILQDLLALAEWVYDPINFHESNHGVMGAIALLHVAVQMRHFEILAARYTTCASKRILGMASTAFDRDGLCNENTIGYHRFNTYLYEIARNFTLKYGIAEHLINDLAPIVDNAKTALQLAVWQNGSVPPNGDSPVYENVTTSINRSFWFSESGLLVIKNDDLYLSLVCGSRGWVHKQCDDSALTLRYKNRDLFIDAGHYTHDHQDPYRLALAGQRGHCGIFLEQCDTMLREEFIRDFGPFEARITNFEEDEISARVNCFYTIQNGAYRVDRSIEVFWPDEILIRDHVTACDAMVTTARQRFILNPTIQLDTSASLSYLRGDGIDATLFHLSPSKLDFYQAESSPFARGWYSVTFGELLKTSGFDFVQSGTDLSFVTAIKLAIVANVEELSPALQNALRERK